MKKAKLDEFIKNYPKEYWSIKTNTDGKVLITKKKAIIRVLVSQVERLTKNGTASVRLAQALNKAKLRPKDFKQTQITVDKEIAERIEKEAKKCNTRQIMYLQKLLG